MEEIISKYKDKNGYVRELDELRRELESFLTKDEASSIIKDIYDENERIIKSLERENKRLESIGKLKNKKKELLDYVVVNEQDKEEKKVIENKNKEYDDISFYIEYIELNLDNDSYLSILPSTKKSDDIKLLDRIIAYFIKEMNVAKYFLSTDSDDSTLEMYEVYNNVYQKILAYKNDLFLEEKTEEKLENEVCYYMNGDETYLYTDIEDNPEIYESIKMLLDSLKNGEFKNIKNFNNNEKTRGLLELRDLTNRTRLLFDVVGYKKYCVIGAIVNKTSTNSLYKDRIINRYSKYKADKENVSKDEKSLTKIFRGDVDE